MNKQSITLLAVLVLVNCSAFAAPTNEQLYQMLLELKEEVETVKQRETDLKNELHQTKSQLRLAQQQLDKSSYATVSETKLKNTQGFFASAGGLYVTPMIDYFTPRPLEYIPGFQVSAGYQAADNWDYKLNFKYFDGYSSSGYGFNYSVLDFEVGKQLSLSNSVSLRVSGGLRYAAVDEKINKFWGVGPRITASPTWKPFNNGFRVFGDVAASFLLGQNNYVGPGGQSREKPFIVAEAGAGIGYTFDTRLIDLDISAGYQFEHWSDSELSKTYATFFKGYHGSYGKIGVKF